MVLSYLPAHDRKETDESPCYYPWETPPDEISVSGRSTSETRMWIHY
jgi:hypothetical protein